MIHIKETKVAALSEEEQRLADEILWKNEINSNRITATAMLIIVGILSSFSLAYFAGFYRGSSNLITGVTLKIGPLLAIPALVCLWLRGEHRWLKYLLILTLLAVLGMLDAALTYNAVLLMAVPVVVSSRYFSRRFTLCIAALTVVVFLASCLYGLTHGALDVNLVWLPKGTVLNVDGYIVRALDRASIDTGRLRRTALLSRYLPKLLTFIVISVTCLNIAKNGRNMVLKQAEITHVTASIAAELNMAADIQLNALPNEFPAFPERTEFDLYATMTPAKEVGGDFYDFYLVDQDHLALVMADVSDKGVPAALFMMTSRTMLKDAMLTDRDPAAVLKRVNAQLCENNPDCMFVTVWLGLLEISTGKLTWADAGHEQLLLCQDGGWTMLPMGGGVPLAAFDPEMLENDPEPVFRNRVLQLRPGDVILQYTDGVTEAMNASGDLFRSERLMAAVNCAPSVDPMDLLPHIRGRIEDFVQGAAQSDDITMLAMRYQGVNRTED